MFNTPIKVSDFDNILKVFAQVTSIENPLKKQIKFSQNQGKTRIYLQSRETYMEVVLDNFFEWEGEIILPLLELREALSSLGSKDILNPRLSKSLFYLTPEVSIPLHEAEEESPFEILSETYVPDGVLYFKRASSARNPEELYTSSGSLLLQNKKGKLLCVSSDGHRISITKPATKITGDTLLFPGLAVNSFLACAKKFNVSDFTYGVSQSAEDEFIFLKGTGSKGPKYRKRIFQWTIHTQKPSYSFPRYEVIIPKDKEYKCHVVVEKQSLQTWIKQIITKENSIIDINVDQRVFTIGSEIIPSHDIQGMIQIRCDGKFFLDYLQELETPLVSLSFINAVTPVRIMPSPLGQIPTRYSPEYTLIMPIMPKQK